jgi:hypothetical protein
MIDVKVNVTDGASEGLRDLISQLTGPGLAELNSVGGRAAAQAAKAFSKAFDDAGGWRTSRRFPSSGPSRFGGDVAQGWAFLVADATGALIFNDATHYAFKVRGGAITAKRVRYLTLPMIPEAKGLRAAVYQQNTGRKLFTIPGKKALFEKTSGGTSKKPGVRAVYALVKSVTQAAMPEAVPPDEVIASAFTKAWIDKLTTPGA